LYPNPSVLTSLTARHCDNRSQKETELFIVKGLYLKNERTNDRPYCGLIATYRGGAVLYGGSVVTLSAGDIR